MQPANISHAAHIERSTICRIAGLRAARCEPPSVDTRHQGAIGDRRLPRAADLVALLANTGILTTGNSVLEAYDRLEVAEFSARSLLDSLDPRPLRPIDDAAIAELRRRFGID